MSSQLVAVIIAVPAALAIAIFFWSLDRVRRERRTAPSTQAAPRATPRELVERLLKPAAETLNQRRTVQGKPTLADLFAGRSQLVVQHFMFAPDWTEGCKSCSFWAGGFERMIPHLAARDTTLVAISRAPLQKLNAFKARMGWTFDWLSSSDTDFNYDYAVSFKPEEIKSGAKVYNFGTSGFGVEEAPGISVFYRDEAGTIFHTYSCFARGLDMMNAAYHYLDLTPLGRHEEGLPYPMDWVRLRDQYTPAPVQASCCHR